jgi:hypothetical protein
VARRQSTAEQTIEIPEEEIAGKGHATPTRREREAANKRPLVPSDRKVASKDARTQNQIAREKARVGMANGDERYLPARDKGAQRKYVRDYVDARYNLGELLIPVMFLVIVVTLLPMPDLQAGVMMGLYAFIVLVLADSVIMGFIVLKKIRDKFGADKVERGLRWYATMRSLQFRRLRLPKPQVKRRQYPS